LSERGARTGQSCNSDEQNTGAVKRKIWSEKFFHRK